MIGLTIAERESFPRSERKLIYKEEDEQGNNAKGYNWQEFGPGSFFGQEITYWSHIEDVPTFEEVKS